MPDARLPDPRREILRTHPAVKSILKRWRRLTAATYESDAQRRTVVAVSGGADSVAMLLALSTTPAPLLVAHIVHDLREPELAQADATHVQQLAETLSLPFLQSNVVTKVLTGNDEAIARSLRYRALMAMANAHGYPFVATAHHADDQAETILMRLMRGTGPRGLRGILASRRLNESTRVIRPCLDLRRSDTESICQAASVPWVNDHTNRDTTRLRSALRALVLPSLNQLSPHSTTRLANVATWGGEVDELLSAAAHELARNSLQKSADGTWVLPRSAARQESPVVLGEFLLQNVASVKCSPSGRSWRTIRPIALAMCDNKDHRREFHLGASILIVDAARITCKALVLHCHSVNPPTENHP